MAYQMKQRPGYMQPPYPPCGMGKGMDMTKPAKPAVPTRPGRPNTMPPEIMNFPVGMAYVPWQEWKGTYDLNKGFHTGTIFPELDYPFTGRCTK